ncbi:hypothetical protein [Candidatus Soleaferrea massiliensis]|uniref:hypothetical protein n=1 Tax=Candidatus Soleaferrea massiliensis TaxID=1470354 RepID=UPI0012E01EDA|nr:hypothetical protein [Candidatus Soleaferrea massiliensis]
MTAIAVAIVAAKAFLNMLQIPPFHVSVWFSVSGPKNRTKMQTALNLAKHWRQIQNHPSFLQLPCLISAIRQPCRLLSLQTDNCRPADVANHFAGGRKRRPPLEIRKPITHFFISQPFDLMHKGSGIFDVLTDFPFTQYLHRASI